MSYLAATSRCAVTGGLAIVLVVMAFSLSAGCSYDESLAEMRCGTPGARQGGEVCRDGFWVDDSPDGGQIGDWGFTDKDGATGADSLQGVCLQGHDCPETCSLGDQRRTTKPCGYKERGVWMQDCRQGYWRDARCVGVWYRSCREVLEAIPRAEDGRYRLDPDGPQGAAPAGEYACIMEDGGWTLVERDTFEDSTESWVGTDRRHRCGDWGKILGGHCALGSSTVSKSFDFAPVPHTTIRLYLEVVQIDSWDYTADDRVVVQAGGQTIWSEALWGGRGRNVCGESFAGFLDQKFKISEDFDSTGTTLDVSVTGQTDEPPCNESWGLDNVHIFVR